MTKLMRLISLTVLILLISGCTNQGNLSLTKQPKIDETLEMVDFQSIKSISDMTAIAFEWRKVDDTRVIGYHFYRANMQEDGTKLKLIDTIKNKYVTHFLDEDLEPNTKYMYKISAATNGEVESRTTNDYIVSTLPRFESVSFIQAISNLPRQIKIVWRPHSNERVESYKIEKSSPETTKWKKIANIKGRLEAEFIDDDLEDNVVYNYKITALTFDDIESLPSEIVKAQTKPLPQGNLSLVATNNLPRKISLNWQASETADITRYNIYRSTDSNSGFDIIKAVNAQTFLFDDFINEDGKVYFYKITAVDKDNLESDLNINSVMGITLSKLNKPIITLAQIQGERAILNWQAGDARAVSYNIIKTTKESFFKTKTSKIEGITDIRYEDQDIVRGTVYAYGIQAVDEFGIVSEITNKTELVLPKLKELN